MAVLGDEAITDWWSARRRAAAGRRRRSPARRTTAGAGHGPSPSTGPGARPASAAASSAPGRTLAHPAAQPAPSSPRFGVRRDVTAGHVDRAEPQTDPICTSHQRAGRRNAGPLLQRLEPATRPSRACDAAPRAPPPVGCGRSTSPRPTTPPRPPAARPPRPRAAPSAPRLARLAIEQRHDAAGRGAPSRRARLDLTRASRRGASAPCGPAARPPSAGRGAAGPRARPARAPSRSSTSSATWRYFVARSPDTRVHDAGEPERLQRQHGRLDLALRSRSSPDRGSTSGCTPSSGPSG